MSARRRGEGRRVRRSRTRRGQASPNSLSNAQHLMALRRWLLPNEGIFVGLARHGNTKWRPADLIWLALCWGWAESKNVTDAFETALGQCRLLGLVPLSTYQGFMHALVGWTDRLMVVMWPRLHVCLERIGGPSWQVGDWVPIAFDGSRSSAPRTKANEEALCAANYGQGMTAKYRRKKTKGMRRRKNEQNKPQPQKPQAWITLMWHMGLRLPWMWRLGPSNSSERAHVNEMLQAGDFPKNTLFCGDAGFVGYPLWSQILSAGSHFLVRVGSNVNLLSESTRWRSQDGARVVCWPQAARNSGGPPLRLRLVRVKIGKTKMWMLTSVLESGKLTQNQIVRLYSMRWGIEVEFRGLKQTLDRAKLRCRNDRRLLAELNWSLLAMTVAELFALKQQLKSPRKKSGSVVDLKRRSLAKTIRALRSCLGHLESIPAPGEDLLTRLRLAVTDNYVRQSSKRARYHPRNPDKKPIGEPRIEKLTAKHQRAMDALNAQTAA
jgi:hypothetical protein